jgi:hypothetical protein
VRRVSKKLAFFLGGGGLIVLVFLQGFLRKMATGRGVLMVNSW